MPVLPFASAVPRLTTSQKSSQCCVKIRDLRLKKTSGAAHYYTGAHRRYNTECLHVLRPSCRMAGLRITTLCRTLCVLSLVQVPKQHPNPQPQTSACHCTSQLHGTWNRQPLLLFILRSQMQSCTMISMDTLPPKRLKLWDTKCVHLRDSATSAWEPRPSIHIPRGTFLPSTPRVPVTRSRPLAAHLALGAG